MKIKIMLVALSIAAISVGVGAQQVGQPLQVAIYPFDAIGIEETAAMSITNAIASALSESRKIKVRDQVSTRAAIEQIGLAQSGHCAEDKCRVEAGKILKAQKIIMGSIEKLDQNYYTIRMRVVDVQSADTEYQVARDCPCTGNIAIRNMAVELCRETILVFLETGKKVEAGTATPPPPPPTQPEIPSVGPTPPLTPSAGTGAILIATNPTGAEVFLDAQPVGKTPLTIPGVAAGVRQLTITLKGYATLTKSVEVRANQTTQVSEILSRQTGAIDLQSTPPGADCWVDGKYIGKTPRKIPAVGVGKHAVKITMPNYSDYTAETNVEANETAVVNAPLAGLPGRILVTSEPDGAEVHIDGKKAGVTTYNGPLAPGNHQVRVSINGYQSAEETVTIEPNKPKTLNLILKKGPDVRGDMVLVPAGEFTMGSDSGEKDEKPIHKVYLDAFQIDKCEVTNEQYAACVQAGGCSENQKYNGFTDPKQPVVGVDWNQADTYCKWAGKRLPTEAEWEKAARGTDGRTYPWGEGIDCSKANYADCKKGTTTPVGSYPNGASPYGAMDMAGNVWEWTADWYGEEYYRSNPSRNPKGPSSGTSRVLRGGSWGSGTDYLRVADRSYNGPSLQFPDKGFRCARTQ